MNEREMLQFIVDMLTIFGVISIFLICWGAWGIFKHFINRNTK